MTMLLALSFLTGTVCVSFADDAPAPKKAKKGKKKKADDGSAPKSK